MQGIGYQTRKQDDKSQAIAAEYRETLMIRTRVVGVFDEGSSSEELSFGCCFLKVKSTGVADGIRCMA